MTHWARDYIGRRWEAGAEGPDAFDCWQFVRYVYRHHYRIDLPLVPIDPEDLRAVMEAFTGHEERSNWTQVSIPADGDVVLMARREKAAHVGIYVVDGSDRGVIHCRRGAGVIFDRLTTLRAGWPNLEYFRR